MKQIALYLLAAFVLGFGISIVVPGVAPWRAGVFGGAVYIAHWCWVTVERWEREDAER